MRKLRILIAPALMILLSVSAFPGLKPVVRITSQATQIDRGAAGLGQAIKRLGVVATVLHTGAHPDDESSGLLAYLARGRQARTAYLSLTRGDGGQNLIGPELYEALGVIRTDELLAARELDGALQFFSRAFDFGFSKRREETLSKWDREIVLGDMVRVIRAFRPDVIVSAWTGTEADGHGHHQAAGVLTQEAFRAAADPARFPEQIVEGLKPWQAKKLYTGRGEQQSGPNILTINTGQYDPLLGRSYYEIAMQGRSQHRSQDQGAIEQRGPRYTRLRLIESKVGTPGEEKDIFDGIDITLPGIAQRAGAGAEKLKPLLTEAQKAADEAREKYNPFSPAQLTPILARGLKSIRDALALLPSLSLNDSALYEIKFLLTNKEQGFADALAKSSGLIVDCLADDEIVSPGQKFALSVTAYANASDEPVAVSLRLPEGWAAIQSKQNRSTTDGRLIWQTDFTVTAANNAEHTEPYWLRQPRQGDTFAIEKGATGIYPYTLPAVAAQVEFTIGGQKISLSQPAQYRYVDKALGEIRRDLKVAPAVSVTASPDILIVPLSAGATEREVAIALTNNDRQGSTGKLRLELPSGWKATPAEAAFDLKREGERAGYTFKVSVPANVAEGNYDLQAIASVGDRNYQKGYQVISYPHTEPRLVYRAAKVTTEVFDVKVAPGLQVGFIEGAGDGFDEALKRLEVDVKTISPAELAAGDLSKYDCIVTGVRVYEVRPDVIANNARLLEYVRRGGVLIVQYNKSEYAAGNFAPYPIRMERSIERVTDERAPVTILEPAHPLFTFPNKITARDFDNWVQERGAYFLSGWDERFKPLLSSADPGEGEKRGGHLIAEYGQGHYIYTAYGWFRQLPKGVPGAYRLVANLVSLAKAKEMQKAPAR